jgi:hypothetical protein
MFKRFFIKFLQGLKNVFSSFMHSVLFIAGIAIIIASALGIFIDVPFLSKTIFFARIFSTLGGCLGMFIISLTYGSKYFATDSDNTKYHPALDSAKKEIEERFNNKFEAEINNIKKDVAIDKLKDKLKEEAKKILEKQREIEETKFQIDEKQDEIDRLKSMNNTVDAMSTALKLIVFEARVKRLDLVKDYIDDYCNKIEIEFPTGKLFDNDRVYNEYYGITSWEYGLEGGVDLNKIKIWEDNGVIFFSGITLNKPSPINPQAEQLLGQKRTIRITKDKNQGFIELPERILDDDFAKGVLNQQKEFNKSSLDFDDDTKGFIEKSAVSFIKLFLAPFGKDVEYVPLLINDESKSLPLFFQNKIEAKINEKEKLEIQYQDKEKAYQEYSENIDEKLFEKKLLCLEMEDKK